MKTGITNKKSIVVNGHTLTSISPGVFSTSRIQLGAYDLSKIPVRTGLEIRTRPKPTDYAWVTALTIPWNGGIIAHGEHWPPDTGLDIILYKRISKKLLNDSERSSPKPSWPWWAERGAPFSLTVSAVSFGKIEEEVRGLVRAILQPLLDFDQATRDEITRRFDV